MNEAKTISGEAPKGFWGDAAWAVMLMTGLFFFNISGRIVLSPLMPEIEADLGISHADAGSLFFLISSAAASFRPSSVISEIRFLFHMGLR